MTWYWHVHHDVLVEEVTHSIEDRISYIKQNKPRDEIATRLRLLNPAKRVDSALAEYEKTRQSAWAEYKKTQQSALAEYEKTKQPALAEYEKTRQSALAEYEKTQQSAWAEYKKTQQSAWAECEKTRQKLHKEQCPNCPWDGTTIFPS